MKRVFLVAAASFLLLAVQTNSFGGLPGGFVSSPAQQPTPQPEVTPASGRVVSWRSLAGPYERLVFDVLVDRADPQVLYAATWGSGLYQSIDGGATWQPASLLPKDCDVPAECDPRLFEIRALAQSFSGDIFISRWGGGVYRSADQGKTWKFLSTFTSLPLEAMPSYDGFMVVDKLLDVTTTNGEERVYAATRDGIFFLNTSVFETQGKVEWRQAVQGIPEDPAARHIQTLAVHEGNLYAGSFGGGLFVSTDWGEHWSSMGPTSEPENKIYTVLPLDGGVLMGTGGAGVLWSEDERKTWEPHNTGLPDNPFARRVQALTADGQGMVYAGTVDYGVYRSTDGGQTWEASSTGLTKHALSIVHLSTDPSGRTIYAGTYGEGVYRSTDQGTTWLPLSKGLPVDHSFKVQSLAADGQTLLVGTYLGGMYVASLDDEDVQWRRVPRGLPIGPARDIADIVISSREAGRPVVTLAAGTGIFHSVNDEEVWYQVKTGLPQEGRHAVGLAQGRHNPQIIYAVLDDEDSLFRSDDGGLIWVVPGDLPLKQKDARVTDLVVGANDNTLYVGFGFEGVWVTHDSGKTWKRLQRAGPSYIAQLAFESRPLWQQVLLGGPRRTLCALAWNGIYCSYDDGQHWELSIEDRFNTILMDPARPGTIYAVSPKTILDVPAPPAPVLTFTVSPPPVADLQSVVTPVVITPSAAIATTQPITARPATFWISQDIGHTWQPTQFRVEKARSEPEPDVTSSKTGAELSETLPQNAISESDLDVIVLALDPNRPDLIYAGTYRNGVLQGQLHLPSVWATPRAVMSLTFLIAVISLGMGFVAYAWWSLSRPYGVPLVQALALHIFWRGHLQRVLVHPPLLSPLQCLILATIPNRRFKQDEVQGRLSEVEAHASPSQMANALREMVEKLSLLDQDGSEFRLRIQGVDRIAHAKFWLKETRSLLARRVREENKLYQDVRRFFEAAGFLVHSTSAQFTLLSDQPRYASYAGYEGIYARVASQPQVTPKYIDEVRGEAARFYNAQVWGRLAFLAMALPPPAETFQSITHLRDEQGLTLVPLPHATVRHALAENAAASRIEFSLRRSAGRGDLFHLDGPAIDALDFFGRETELERLVNWMNSGQTVLLGGMPRVGKTSLAWQVSTRLLDNPTAYVPVQHPDVERLGLYGALLQVLLADLAEKLPYIEWPLGRNRIGIIDQSQFQTDLDHILAGLDSQPVRPALSLVVDGVILDQIERTGVLSDLVALAELASPIPGLGLLVVLDTGNGIASTKLENAFQHHLSLLPLTLPDTADLVVGIAAQMGLEFTPEATQRLHLATGGHPQMLRQLSSLAIQLRQDSQRVIGMDLVEEALERYTLQPALLLRLLWRGLSPTDQQLLAQVASLEEGQETGALVELVDLAGGTPEHLLAAGWVRREDSRLQLFSQALARWLTVQGLL